MPQPGVPYRPIVAVPQKINYLNPLFAICEDIFFTALDPPRALVTAPNLVLKPTIAYLQASTTPPMPNRIPKTDPEDNGSARPTTSVPRPAQIPKPPEPQQTVAPGSKIGGKGPGNKDDSSAGSGGVPRKDVNLTGNSSPSVTESDPLQEPQSKPVSESSRNGDFKKGSDQVDSDPTIADGDPRQDVKTKSDPQSNTGTTEDPGQRVGTKSNSQSGTSWYPNRVAAYDPDSGSHSGLEAGDSSDPKDQGHASSGYAEQDSENTQGKNLAIGNHNPGEAVTVNGQVAQPLSDDAISIAGTTLTPGASPITISGIEISLGQSKIAVGSSSVPIATAADSVWIPGRVTTIDSQLIQANFWKRSLNCRRGFEERRFCTYSFRYPNIPGLKCFVHWHQLNPTSNATCATIGHHCRWPNFHSCTYRFLNSGDFARPEPRCDYCRHNRVPGRLIKLAHWLFDYLFR